MNCFPCFHNCIPQNESKDLPIAQAKAVISSPAHPVISSRALLLEANSQGDEPAEANGNSSAKSFTFRELAIATKNFRQELLGEGGFGRVFKGTLQPSGQVVAVRQLDRSGTLGSKEFLAEVNTLSLLQHPNLVSLIGYCADGEQRILVYNYIPCGSLAGSLFDLAAGKRPLNWSSRMKIASGVAEGLEYLHEKATPPLIYRDLKSSNILLDEESNPRLSGYGLSKLMQSGNKKIGYCAPEYESQGELTVKSDVYSFGVVLLELITGRKALDTSQPTEDQNLVAWAQSFFRNPQSFPDMADPLLRKEVPVTSLNQAVGVAAMCLQEEPSVRPLIGDIVAALTFLAMAPPETPVPARLASILSTRVETLSMREHHSVRKDEQVSGRQQEDTPNIADGEEEQDTSESEYECSDPEDQDDLENKEDIADESHHETEDSNGLNSISSSRQKSSRMEPQAKSVSQKSLKIGNSVMSRDDSLNFSLDSTFLDGSMRYDNDYDHGLCSEDELSDYSIGSSSRYKTNDRSFSRNSRSNSKTDKRNGCVRSKTRQKSNDRNKDGDGEGDFSPRHNDNVRSDIEDSRRINKGDMNVQVAKDNEEIYPKQCSKKEK